MTDATFATEPTIADGHAADPILGLPLLDPLEGSGDTWITVGEFETDQERTVTVVFRRDPLDQCDPLEDLETGEVLLRPLAPQFPGPR